LLGAKDVFLLECSPLCKASGGGPLPKDHILMHDLRELHRCVANGIAHHVVLCFDEHRSEFLLRHSRNGVGLIVRVLPTPSHIPNDDAVEPAGRRCLALVEDRHQIIGVRLPPSPPLRAAEGDHVVIGWVREHEIGGRAHVSKVESYAGKTPRTGLRIAAEVLHFGSGKNKDII